MKTVPLVYTCHKYHRTKVGKDETGRCNLPDPQPVLCVQHGTELAVRVFGGTDVNVQLAWEDVYKKNEHTLSKRLPKYTVPTVPKHKCPKHTVSKPPIRPPIQPAPMSLTLTLQQRTDHGFVDVVHGSRTHGLAWQ